MPTSTTWALLNSRYTPFEQKVLRLFGEDPERMHFSTSGGDDQTIQLQNLLTDGFLLEAELNGMAQTITSDDPNFPLDISIPANRLFLITPSGRDYIRRWMGAEEIE